MFGFLIWPVFMFPPEQLIFALVIDALNKINVKYYPGTYPAFQRALNMDDVLFLMAILYFKTWRNILLSNFEMQPEEVAGREEMDSVYPLNGYFILYNVFLIIGYNTLEKKT